MELNSTAQLILAYKYLILIPLAIIEGPIVAFIAGTLASLGYFNIWILAAFFLARDVGMDAIYYCFGYFASRTTFAARMLNKIHVTADHLEGVRMLWERRPFTTMFVGKLSYGIGSTFVAVAGMVKMRFLTFLRYGAIVAAIQYWALLAVGYFYGNSFGGSLSKFLQNIQYVIGAIGLFVTVYYFVSWRMRKRLMKEAEESR